MIFKSNVQNFVSAWKQKLAKLGKNGTAKMTSIHMMAGQLKPNNEFKP